MSLFDHFHSLYPNAESNINTKSLASYYKISVVKVRTILKKHNVQKDVHAKSQYFWIPAEFNKGKIDQLDEIFKSEGVIK